MDILEALGMEFDALAVVVLIIIGLGCLWAIVRTCRDSLVRRERKGEGDA